MTIDATLPATAPAPTTEEIMAAHVGGKLSTGLTAPLRDDRDLAISYTPGVAEVSRAIAADGGLAARYTWAHRLVAVVSDGTAVLGLGDIGPRAALPVMEGKSALFKTFGGLDSIPLVLDTKDVDEIVETLVRLRPSFGAVNLEDVSAPRCFELERRLIEALDCPVMHDDQHGTAIVLLAALRGACAVAGRDLARLRIVISGAGAAGVACAHILLAAGATDVVVLDSRGVLVPGRAGVTGEKAALAAVTNPRRVTGGVGRGADGADVFVGLSCARLPEELLALMAPERLRLRAVQPGPRDPPGGRRPPRRDRRDGPQRLPEPDQQRAGVPRRVPRRARRGCAADHRGDEARGRRRDLLGGRRRPRPAPHRAEPVRSPGGPRGGRGGRGGSHRRTLTGAGAVGPVRPIGTERSAFRGRTLRVVTDRGRCPR